MENKTKYTCGELFAGIGGLSLGLERAGFQTLFQVEFNEYAQGILKKNFPHSKIYGDVKEFPPVEELYQIPDLIAAGMPCQPYSSAGKRKGEQDERYLWPECIRIIRFYRPRFFLLENVPGLLSISGGAVFGNILRSLDEIRYNAEWLHLSAAQCGAPHKRERLFLLASDTLKDGFRTSSFNVEVKRALGNYRKAQGCTCWNGVELARTREATINSVKATLSEPLLLRMGDRTPQGLDIAEERIAACGNAVVPQVGEVIGRAIINLLNADSENL